MVDWKTQMRLSDGMRRSGSSKICCGRRGGICWYGGGDVGWKAIVREGARDQSIRGQRAEIGIRSPPPAKRRTRPKKKYLCTEVGNNNVIVHIVCALYYNCTNCIVTWMPL